MESYRKFDKTFRTLLKNQSLLTNHILSNQIHSLSRYVLQKIQFGRILPSTKEEILAELPHMNLSTILQRNSPLVSREEMGNPKPLYKETKETKRKTSKTPSNWHMNGKTNWR